MEGPNLHLKWPNHSRYIEVSAYHRGTLPSASQFNEREADELNHLRALVYEYRIKEHWSHYLPLVQRIMNYTIDGSIGTQPARVIFGDMIDSGIAMDLPEGTTARNPEDYLVKLREAQSILVQMTQDYLKENQRKRGVDGGRKDVEVTKFSVGDYVSQSFPKQVSRNVSRPNDCHCNGSSGPR